MKTQHFFDSAFTRATKNVEVVTGKVTKHPGPLFTEGCFSDPCLPWEVRYDNGYPNVFYDPDYRLYRCYYTGIVYDETSSSTPLEERATGIVYKSRGPRLTALLYAESRDGIHWDRPNLGITDLFGSCSNNIIRLYAHGSCVFLDTHESDPAKKYKLITRDDHLPRKLCTAYSADGYHFTELKPIPGNAFIMPGDTHNYARWEEDLGKYVMLTRMFTRELRTVARSESTDFLNWSAPVEVFKGMDRDDQIYAMPFFQDEGKFYGLPAIFHQGDESLEHNDCVDIELAFSGDTIQWDRIAPGKALIPRGKGKYPTGDYDCGCCFSCAPVDDGEQWRFYYMGGNGTHYNFRETSLCLATMPKHKLAGIATRKPGQVGEFTSAFMQVNSGKLWLNADLGENSLIEAELLTPKKEPIAGYGFDQFTLKLEQGKAELCWNDQPVNLMMQEFLLHIRFSNAVLYSLQGDFDTHPFHPVYQF